MGDAIHIKRLLRPGVILMRMTIQFRNAYISVEEWSGYGLKTGAGGKSDVHCGCLCTGAPHCSRPLSASPFTIVFAFSGTISYYPSWNFTASYHHKRHHGNYWRRLCFISGVTNILTTSFPHYAVQLWLSRRDVGMLIQQASARVSVSLS